MFPHRKNGFVPAAGFPRVRGDVPDTPRVEAVGAAFSPRARGCSVARSRCASSRVVFPACAGMFLRRPHAHPSIQPFSPRARGCSPSAVKYLLSAIVFPACAGMFPTKDNFICFVMSFPRVRGDVPWAGGLILSLGLFSPRARGCSFDLCRPTRRVVVFPACAGMFPRRQTRPHPRHRFPRVRGDVPQCPDLPVCVEKFSPRARGCSLETSTPTPP